MDEVYYQNKIDKLKEVDIKIQVAFEALGQCVADSSNVNSMMDMICINGEYMAQETRKTIDNDLLLSEEILWFNKI